MIQVVIPYLASAAQGRELELAVAGWRRHFREEFEIVVVGDDPRIEGVTFIPCPRVPMLPGARQYHAHLDHVHKFREVRRHYPDAEGFIYTCDDIYAVRDFTLEDVKRPKVRRDDITNRGIRWNQWVQDNWKTRDRLVRDGLPTRNWVCHLPVWYEWDKLLDIYDRYDCDTTSYVVEQLYFNRYFPDVPADHVEEDGVDWQFKVWDHNCTPAQVREALDRVVWISNSFRGWAPWMEDILRERYGLLDHSQ